MMNLCNLWIIGEFHLAFDLKEREYFSLHKYMNLQNHKCLLIWSISCLLCTYSKILQRGLVLEGNWWRLVLWKTVSVWCSPSARVRLIHQVNTLCNTTSICQGDRPLNSLSTELLQKNISPSRHMPSNNLFTGLKLGLEKNILKKGKNRKYFGS